MSNIPVLQNNRLILRPVTMQDAPAIQKYFNNFEIIKYIGNHVPWPYPDNGAKEFLSYMFERMNNEEIYLWAITLKEHGDEAIGVIEYRFTDKEDDNRGFWLAQPFWGKGIMSDTLKLTQEHVFNALGKDYILDGHAPSNKGSRRVKEKNGSFYIHQKDMVFLTGEMTGEVWKVTPESWATARNHATT